MSPLNGPVEPVEPGRPRQPNRTNQFSQSNRTGHRPRTRSPAPSPATASRTADQAVAQDAAALRQALQADLNRIRPASTVEGPPGEAVPTAPPPLVALCGLPGTGKSHFAAALARRVSGVILGSDRLRKVLIPQPKYTRAEHVRVFAAAHRLLEQLLDEGYRVIFDATNLNEKIREPLYRIAERTGAQLILVEFAAPVGLVHRRLEQRAAGLSSDGWSDADWRIYCRLRPAAEPIERPHVSVDSSRDIRPALNEVARLVGAQPTANRTGDSKSGNRRLDNRSPGPVAGGNGP